MEKLRVGGWLAGQTLTADEIFFIWKGVYGNGFRVPRTMVQVVTVEKTGLGRATLKVLGAGAELAKVPGLPVPWAEAAQAWMMQRIGSFVGPRS